MTRNKIALTLAVVAGLICLAKFVHTYIQTKTFDYLILFAGLFIIFFGISRNMPKRNNH
ncbi:MAG: hypothetical protein JWQ40_1060 [Segetibacter sp.]|nr:hypothetical protein [Segetibacter sp.]